MKRLFSAGVSVLLVLGIAAQVSSVQNKTEYRKAMEYLENGNEVYFRFFNTQRTLLDELTHIISLDNVKNSNEVYAYANTAEFTKFLEYGLYYEVCTHPGDITDGVVMGTPDKVRQSWDSYPDISGYYEIMEDFASEYPDKCRIYQYGTSIRGRKLLYAIISDNVNEDEPEPRVMYTSAMHGDETVMYVNFLRLIDYLLSNYESDDYVKYLVDNVEIWICPLENPDGTYNGTDASVSNARRYNANGVDLNRNYPRAGEKNTDECRPLVEKEAQAVCDLVDSLHFVVSMNVHGGAELLNYPYDYRSRLHADDEWMKYVYRKYANTVHAVNPNYLNDQNNGITNGYQWYQIFGSRMDYHTYFQNCREVTAEFSSTKLVPANSLPNYWNYQKQALLEYIEEALFGINGTVTCAMSGVPLEAKIEVVGHDEENTYTYTEKEHGDFWRPINKGTYTLKITADDYLMKTIEDVSVENDKATVLDIKLDPATPINHEIGELVHSASLKIMPAVNGQVTISHALAGNTGIALYDLSGRQVRSFDCSPKSSVVWDGRDLSGNPVGNGCYLIRLTNSNKSMTKSFILSR